MHPLSRIVPFALLAIAVSAQATVIRDNPGFSYGGTDADRNVATYTGTAIGGFMQIEDPSGRGLRRQLFTTVQTNTGDYHAQARSSIVSPNINSYDYRYTFSSDYEVDGFGGITYAMNAPFDLSEEPLLRVQLGSDSSGVVRYTITDVFGHSATSTTSFTTETSYLTTNPIHLYGVDATQVRSVTVEFDPGQRGDLQVRYIQTVPEPASLAALGLGALALVRRRRKA